MKLSIKENSINYTCNVVEIKNLFPIEGADFIQRTNINGNDVVVSINTKINDIMLYFVSGTKLNSDYCIKNNLLDKPEFNLDTTKKGFISYKQFRVKAIKLKGIISDGMLMPLDSLDVFDSELKNNVKVGDEFTDINIYSLCEKYIIPIKESNNKKNNKQPKGISRLIDGQFIFHNDTENLRKNIDKIRPNDIIGIHYKKHGTSICIGNVLVKKNLKWYEKIAKKLGINVVETDYDIIYSSRKVVKNQYLNSEAGVGFYGEDIWGIVAKEIGHLIPKNWTLYGEILGYLPSGGYIQKGYDYGCKPGEYKFYVYKISIVNPDGKVIYLTDKQIEEWCEKYGLLYKDTFIYYGKAEDIFSHLFTDGVETYSQTGFITYEESEQNPELTDQFRIALLRYLEKTYNENDCYMCINKVPEEGIVLRVEKLDEYEAYKLKSKSFLLMESDLQEKEEINIEDNE